jgi:hypothetical protein
VLQPEPGVVEKKALFMLDKDRIDWEAYVSGGSSVPVDLVAVDGQ